MNKKPEIRNQKSNKRTKRICVFTNLTNELPTKRCIVWDMQMANTKEFYQTNKKRELNLSTLVKGSPCS